MDTTEAILLAVISAMAGAAALLGVALWMKHQNSKRLEQKTVERREDVLGALKMAGYNVYSGLYPEVDVGHKRFTVSGQFSSKTFQIDTINPADQWAIFVYNSKGERRLMSPDTFEMYLLEVRDEEPRRRADAGFEISQASASSITRPTSTADAPGMDK